MLILIERMSLEVKAGIIMYQTSHSKGQELVAQRMVKWFNRFGHKAYLITSIYHDGEEIVKKREIELTIDGYRIFEKDPAIELPVVRVDSDKTTWPPRRIMFRNFVDVLRKLCDELKLNVLITHSTLWNGPEETAKFIMWRRTIKSLNLNGGLDPIYCHMSHYQPPDPTRYSLIERAYRMAWNHLIFPQIFKTADLIICVTPVEAEEMIKMGARPDQIYIFPGGIDDDEFIDLERVDSSEFRTKYDIPCDKKLISYLGTVEERKNPLAIVKIAEKLKDRKDIHFVIAGRPGDQWSEVEKECSKLRNVTLTGELSNEDKLKLIKESYLNIIMSRMEALGLTQLEFMYGGVPVITSGTYGQKWIVRNNIDGIHVNGPDDIDGAVRAIEYLVDNPQVRNEMSINAKERASKFLMSKLMRDFIEKLESVLKMKEYGKTISSVS